MRLLIAVTLLVSVGVASAIVDPAFSDFMEFVSKYERKYESMDELQKRFEIFKTSLNRIQERRTNHVKEFGGADGAVFGITKFSDLTPEEFRAQYLGFRASERALRAHQTQAVIRPLSEIAAPDKVDWRDKGAVTPVKDQGQCGSCWAFSATEEMESMWFLAGHELTKLSVQQVVSCDTTDGGCNGGDTTTAYQYIESVNGLEPASDYSYSSGNGDSGTCQFDQRDIVAHMSNFSYATPPCEDSCDNQDEGTLATNLAATGPVSICVNAEPWQDYTGGVMRSGCQHGYYDLDHCVQLVGYDKTADTPHWIVRNSWNTDWGEEGYIYLEIGKNLCGVADEATIVGI